MKTDVKRVKVGDKLSMTTFMEVKRLGIGSVNVVDEDGEKLTIGDGVFRSNIWSTQENGTVKLTKTELAEKLMEARDAVVKVVFDKADGTERTLIGYIIGAEVVLGRSIAIDLEKEKVVKKNRDGEEYDTRQRLVDHRTLKSLTYKNTLYVLKGKK